ncbi:MAG: ABC transporter substrate-binding protein [Clostridiales bacterium]|nr:ABC transporter substrate-binding protein [Clostridiales bacterium]
MKKLRKLSALLLALTLALTLSACQDKQTPGGEEGDLREVTVILDYIVNTNHTGLYVARELGYYEEAGLKVNIVEPADGTTLTLIAAGKGDFGVGYQEDLTYALTSRDPLPLKAIATVIQHNTSGFSTHVSKDIRSVADFAGKTYAGWGSPAEEAIIRACMEQAGADFSTLTMVTSDGSGYNALEDRVDIIWTFEAWDNVAAELDGVPLNYMELRQLDPRLDYYTPILFTRNDLIEQDPELVRDFMRATAKGYEYAIENPEASAEILHQYAGTYSLEMLTKSQELLSPKYSEDSDAWGLMKAEVWDNYTGFMLEHGLIDRAVPAADCYTNEFLP